MKGSGLTGIFQDESTPIISVQGTKIGLIRDKRLIDWESSQSLRKCTFS